MNAESSIHDSVIENMFFTYETKQTYIIIPELRKSEKKHLIEVSNSSA